MALSLSIEADSQMTDECHAWKRI